MNFDGDRYSSAWAHIALCADLTWATEPPDEFIIANQRLWAQHCHVSQVLRSTTSENSNGSSTNQCEITDKRLTAKPNYENGSYSGRLSVKDVIPESRLAQFYGNFYYDEHREKCYSSSNESVNGHNYTGNGCGNPDLTECWMLPDVEFWFRKLMDDSIEPRGVPRRRRQYKMVVEEDFERLGPEAALAARVRGVRSLWQPSPQLPHPPCAASAGPPPAPSPRKMRARRRQPRRLTHAPPPRYCLQAPVPLLCDPACKFLFDSPQPPRVAECQRSLGPLSANVQAVMRASAARCSPYRGTNISRYTPTSQRPARCTERRTGIWWPRNYISPRFNAKLCLNQQDNQKECLPSTSKNSETKMEVHKEAKNSYTEESTQDNSKLQDSTVRKIEECEQSTQHEGSTQDKTTAADIQVASTSSAASDIGLIKKRLYSTVLSTQPLSLTNVRLQQKSTIPGLLKLNPKIVLPAARIKAPNVDNKFEELEKEALEQYKPSDESIDTKFSELEKQAVEQYTTSNSNTSCSSGNSADKRGSTTIIESNNKKHHAKFRKDNPVDSVVIYSQNFPDLNTKGQTSSMMNLKNFHTPPRGEKKEQTHRSCKNLRNLKNESQRAVSDTDYEAKERKAHKGSMRWTLHVLPPKKRHLAACASDTSDEESKDTPCCKNRVGSKVKMSAHGGGDLHRMIRKSN